MFGSILKIFWEPTSIDVRVVLLVEDDTMGKHLHPYIESRTLRVNTYVHSGLIDKEIGLHISKNLTGLSRLVPFLEDFWEPMSVGVKVVLLVEDETTLYIPIELETLRVFMCMYMYQQKDGLSHYQN